MCKNGTCSDSRMRHIWTGLDSNYYYLIIIVVETLKFEIEMYILRRLKITAITIVNSVFPSYYPIRCHRHLGT